MNTYSVLNICLILERLAGVGIIWQTYVRYTLLREVVALAGPISLRSLEWLRKKLDGGVSGAGCGCWHHLEEFENAG
jgi:hypothetical protein